MLTIVFLFIRARSPYSYFYECFTEPERVSVILNKRITNTKIGASVGIPAWEITRCAQILQNAGYNVIISENKEGE